MITLSLVVFLIANMLSHSYSPIASKNPTILLGNIGPIHFSRVAILVLLAASAISLQSLYPCGWVSFPVDTMKNVPILSDTIVVGSLYTTIELLVYLASAGCLVAAINNKGPREFSIIVLFSVLGASVLIGATDILSLYLGIELQSFGLYTLAALYYQLYPKSYGALTTAAGLKYFLLGALASSTILLGISIIYAYTGTTSLENISILLSVDSNTNTSILFGLSFVFVGLLFKLSAAPFHSWAPDVYDDTPTLITTFLIVVPKVAYVTVIASIIHAFFPLIVSFNLLYFSAILSLVIGAVVGLTQTRIVRMLTYSTISHVGFMLLALSSISIESHATLIFYIIQYTITNLATFMVLIHIGTVILGPKKDISLISSLKGLAYSHPILAFTLTVLLLSTAGVPPAVGFFAKYSVLYSIILSQQYSLAALAVLSSVVSAVYYLSTIATMYFSERSELGTIITVNINNTISYIIAALTIFIISFSLFPNLILNCTMVLALTSTI